MDYDAFEKMDEEPFKKNPEENEQSYMERTLRTVCETGEEGGRVNDMLQARFVECDSEDQSLTLEFTVQDWMRNPGGNLHGGILTTTMDMTLGMLARYYKQTRKVVTVHLSVNFLRGVKACDRFRIYAKADKAGKRVIFMSGRAILENEETAATVTATFM